MVIVIIMTIIIKTEMWNFKLNSGFYADSRLTYILLNTKLIIYYSIYSMLLIYYNMINSIVKKFKYWW